MVDYFEFVPLLHIIAEVLVKAIYFKHLACPTQALLVRFTEVLIIGDRPRVDMLLRQSRLIVAFHICVEYVFLVEFKPSLAEKINFLSVGVARPRVGVLQLDVLATLTDEVIYAPTPFCRHLLIRNITYL